MKNRLLIFLIVAVGFLLRVWRIADVPPNLGNDEISIAYDSYSIITTGKDSSGAFLPLSFRSNNDFKAPLYVYVAGPFIKILGNNELAVRLPSVIIGTLTILTLYLLVNRITGSHSLSLGASFLLAIAPWHIYTSRIALEANLALGLLTFGVYFFFVSFTKRKYLWISTFLLALSVYSYHTELVFTPLIMIFLGLTYHKKFVNKRDLYLWVLLFLILITPYIVNWFAIRNMSNRVSTAVILNDPLLGSRLSGVVNPISKVFIFLSFWINKFLKYLGFDYIFVNGLPVSAPYAAPEFGLLTLVSLPLFVIGLFRLLLDKNTPVRNFWLYWVFIGALISSLTLGELNLVRYLVSVIPLVVIAAYGLVWVAEKKGKVIFLACIILLLFNFAFFYKYYINQFPFHFSENWQYGYKQVAGYIKENGSKYKKIIIDPRFGVANNNYIGVPSFYLLYFNKMDPQVFLDTKKSEDGTFEFMGKYYLREVDWTKEVIEDNTLYVVSVHSNPLAIQEGRVREINSINILDGTKAFKFYESI